MQVQMIQGRAKRKMVTNITTRELADLASKKGNDELAKSFWNTYYCLDEYVEFDGRLYANYCKNRFCTVCAAIRKAEIMNSYLPLILQWPDPHFVTLTVKALSAGRLDALIDSVNKGMNGIIRQYYKRYERGTGQKLIGIKSLECNFNPLRRTYNPHFHLIVATKEMAEILVKEWLKKSKPYKTSYKAQDMQRMDNGEKCLMEVLKYTSKLFTEPDLKKKMKRGTAPGTKRKIYLNALYTSIEAMQGRRVFSSFGFKLPKSQNSSVKTGKEVEYFNVFYYYLSRTDWFDSDSDAPLTGYRPEASLSDLLHNRMDKELN